MHPTYQFSHTYGYLSQRFRWPLLFPQASDQTCGQPQSLNQRARTERINSQSKELGIKQPKVRNLNSLTSLVINARARPRVRQINACLLNVKRAKIALRPAADVAKSPFDPFLP